MKKKKFLKKLNSQKGLTGADVMISILLILTTLEVILMVYSNLTTNSKQVERNAGATRIATNIIENMASIPYDDVEKRLGSYGNSPNIVHEVSGSNTVFDTTIPKGYKVTITIDKNFEFDVVKKVDVEVEYLDTVTKQNQNVTLSKVFERQAIRECNSPNFDDEYIRQMVRDNEYLMWWNYADATGDGKIICPLRYNRAGSRYELVSENNINSLWYSYSNKQWARVLVVDESKFAETFDTSTNALLNTKKDLLKGDDSYVWIPRFGVDDTEQLFSGTYFKYKNSNLAIKQSESDFLYNFVEELEWSVSGIGISFENSNNKLVGNWSKYSNFSSSSSDAYYLNNSKYGPMIEY